MKRAFFQLCQAGFVRFEMTGREKKEGQSKQLFCSPTGESRGVMIFRALLIPKHFAESINTSERETVAYSSFEKDAP